MFIWFVLTAISSDRGLFCSISYLTFKRTFTLQEQEKKECCVRYLNESISIRDKENGSVGLSVIFLFETSLSVYFGILKGLLFMAWNHLLDLIIVLLKYIIAIKNILPMQCWIITIISWRMVIIFVNIISNFCGRGSGEHLPHRDESQGFLLLIWYLLCTIKD